MEVHRGIMVTVDIIMVEAWIGLKTQGVGLRAPSTEIIMEIDMFVYTGMIDTIALSLDT